MGFLLAIGFIVLIAFFYNVAKSVSSSSSYAEDAQTSAVEKQPDTESQAVAFCNTLFGNQAVLTMADRLFKEIESKILFSFTNSRTNQINQQLPLYVKSYGIDTDSSQYKFLSDGTIYFPPEELFAFSEYGVQTLSEPYKVHGLGLALDELVRSKLKDFSIVGAEHFYVEMSRFLGDDTVTITVSWQIRQTKFIEL